MLSEEWLVAADPPLPEDREPLSAVDEWLSRSSHWLGFSLRFDAALDYETVRRGLQRTLAHIPALGARVDAAHNSLQYTLALLPGNQGVVLEHVTGSLSDGKALPDDTASRERWREAGLDAPGPGFEGEPSLQDPLMRARLVNFESAGVSFLCIGISHGLCDGHGIVDILQTWSHFCSDSMPGGLPVRLCRPRAFGQRVTAAVRPAKDDKELDARVALDLGCAFHPLSEAYRDAVMAAFGRQETLELRVHTEKLGSLRAAVSQGLAEGEWVSRFELLFGTLIAAQRATALPPDLPNHNLHVACNLRGRAQRFPADYFGNAAFDFRQPLSSLPPAGTAEVSHEAIASIARAVHSAVRAGLSDPEGACRAKDWFEAARHLGWKNRYDSWAPVILEALEGQGTFVNSWRSDPGWLQVQMGGGADAVAMAVFFGVCRNLLVDVPRHRASGDSTVHIALEPAHAHRFTSLVRAHGEWLPLSIVSP